MGDVFTSGSYTIMYVPEHEVLEATVSWRGYHCRTRIYIGTWMRVDAVFRQMADRIKDLKRKLLESGFAREKIEVSSAQYSDLHRLRSITARFGR